MIMTIEDDDDDPVVDADSDDGEFAMDSAAIGAELSKASASARWAGTLMRRTRASALQRRQRPRATRSTRS